MNKFGGRLWIVMMLMVAPLELAADPIVGRAEIFSGETLKVGGILFRLQGIDAPEPGQICRNKSGKSFDCGRISATGMMDLTVGVDVRCIAKGSLENSPVVATCYADGYDLSEGMVYTGWAFPDPQTGAAYKKFERQAQVKKQGLWAGEFELPWIWRENHL